MRFPALLAIVSIIFFTGHATSHAATVQIQQTGQAASYFADDDGALQTGQAWPVTRFLDNGDQTVTDNLTGLIWTKDANLMTTRDSAFDTDAPQDGAVNWQLALDYVKKLNNENYLGHNDWRLPTILELASLIHRGQADQVAWLTGQGFSGVKSGKYWSSNSLDDILKTSARSVDLQNSLITRDTKSSAVYVWPVRTGSPTGGSLAIVGCGKSFCYNNSGVAITCTGTGQDGELGNGAVWPSPRFVDNRDQTLTDNLTGLVWSQSANTPGPALCAPGTAKTWQGALDYVKCLNTNSWLGKADWRLPNLNELQSLIYYGRFNSIDWLKGQGFTNVAGPNFWSSTTSAINTAKAWAITYAGDTAYPDKTTNANYLAVWPVRAGSTGSAASLSVAVTGGGTVTSSSGGINCGATCSANYPSGKVVTLTATPDNGASASGWTGCDSSDRTTCTIIATGTRNVTAIFEPIPASCGSAFGGSFSSPPAASLCTSGSASSVTAGSTTWNWTCSTGGTPDPCFAIRTASGNSSSFVMLPQTGQTTCYETSGAIGATAEIPCAGTGQDGDKRAGKAWPYPRFTDNHNGSVTDNLTGLVWLKDAACFWTTWQDSLDKIKALKGDGSQCGLTDGSSAGQWRLPNRKEMQSLIDRQRLDPALSIGHPFLGFNSYGYNGRFLWYWTSTYVSSYPSFAWMVNMYDGAMDREQKANQTSLYAWPVRDGQTGVVQLPRTGQADCRPMVGTDMGTTPCPGTGQDGELQKGVAWPIPRLVDNGNGTITDKLTGLIWLKDANCTDTVGGIGKSGIYLTWADSLTWSNNLKSGFCGLTDNSAAGDWRLPNAVELESLVDADKSSPALPLNYPFQNASGGGLFHTSTTAVGNAIYDWIFIPLEGYLEGFLGSWNYGKGNLFTRVWPVRGGVTSGVVNSVIPPSVSFGTKPVGSSSNRTVSISNAIAVNRMTIFSVSIIGTDADQFSVNPGDGSGYTCGAAARILSSGGFCTVSVSFIPTSGAVKSALLRFSTSDAVNPNTDVVLSGTGFLNGVCGPYDKTTLNVLPNTNLCTAGVASTVNGSGPWSWTCQGAGGGTDAACSADITTFALTFSAGSHGSLSGTASQTVKNGATASTVTAVADPTYAFVNWTEGGSVVSTNVALSVSNVSGPHAYTANFAVDYGVCGSSNGVTFTSAPSSNLCTAGIVSAFSGTGPWSWKCVNALGGPDAVCSAAIQTYAVTPLAEGAATITPSAPVSANAGSRLTFTASVAPGYGLVIAGCGGIQTGNTFVTAPLTGACSVTSSAVSRNANSGGTSQPTLLDAMRALQAYNNTPQHPADLIRYDVAPIGPDGLPAGNGVVDFADVIMVLRRVVGIGSW